MTTPSVRDLAGADEATIAALVERVRRLEAELGAPSGDPVDRTTADRTTADRSASGRKPKGGPLAPAMRDRLVAKRERLELARLAEHAASEELKAAVIDAAAAGSTYREIAEVIGVTRARVHQIVSGSR